MAYLYMMMRSSQNVLLCSTSNTFFLLLFIETYSDYKSNKTHKMHDYILIDKSGNILYYYYSQQNFPYPALGPKHIHPHLNCKSL